MKKLKVKVTCPIDFGYVDGRGYLVITRKGEKIVRLQRFASRAEQLKAAKAVRS